MAPKPKEKPKPSQPVSLEDLFTTLNRHIQRSEYEQAVKVADQVLSTVPGDEDALRCKVVALVKADDIDRAFSTIQASKKLPIDLNFYEAYCLYRQNKLVQALESLRSQERTRDTMLLEAQILYRLGRMDACMDVYQKLNFESLEINIVAGLISAGRASEVQGTMDALRVKANSSFELAYNIACSLIETTKYTDAEQHLLSARRIGQETLMEENWADDEIEIELAPIAVQLAYVRQLLGHPQEAMQAYVEIINRNLVDDLSIAVAINNLIASRGPKDVSDGLRKLDKVMEKGDGSQSFQLISRELDLKLSPKQREAIYSNRALLLLHANKIDQAREIVAALPDMFPGSVMPVLLQAAVHVKDNKAGRAEEILGQFADKFPDKSKVILLARAQIAAAAGHAQIAADSLSKISDIQHMPATVATLVSLKERVGDIDGASGVLDSAICWWSNAMTEDNKLEVIMNEAAAFKLKHGREEEAARVYEDLVKSHGSVEALVGLVSTAARVDVAKAEAYEKQLKPLPGLKGVDVDSLEKSSGAKYDEDGGQLRNIEVFDEGKGKSKSKKKRKRKPKYPKGFDPANPGPPPDPERWLPKRERSSYRPKRKDKRAAQVRGSQGSVSREATAASTTTSVANSKANQATASTSKPEQPKAASSKSSRKKSRK